MFDISCVLPVLVTVASVPWAPTYISPESGDSALYYEVTADFRVLEVDYGEHRARTVLTIDEHQFDPDATIWGHVGRRGLPSFFFADSTRRGFDSVFVFDSETKQITPAGISLNTEGDSKFVPLGESAFQYSHLPALPSPESEAGLYFYDTGETIALPEGLKLVHADRLYGREPDCVYIILGHPHVKVQRMRLIDRTLTVEAVTLPDITVPGNSPGTSFKAGIGGVALFAAYNLDPLSAKYFLYDLDRQETKAVSQSMNTRYMRPYLSKTAMGDYIFALVGLERDADETVEAGWFTEHRIIGGTEPWPELGRVEYDPEKEIALVDKDGRMKVFDRCRFDTVMMRDFVRTTDKTAIRTWEERSATINLIDDALHGREIPDEERWKLEWIKREPAEICELEVIGK